MRKSVYIIQTPPFWLKSPPLSLVYLKSYLKKDNIPTGLIDLNAKISNAFKTTPSQWLSLSEKFENNIFKLTSELHPQILEDTYKKIENSEFIGLPLFKRNINFAFSLAEKIMKKFPDKKVIFGGPQTSSLSQAQQLNSKNYWIIGEGEKPLTQIVNGSKDKIYNFDELSSLDEIPFYDFEGLDIKNYSPQLPLLSSRGCPYKCNFCSEKLLSKTFRHHSPEYMLEQIKYLKSKYLANAFVFCDSLINYKNSWLAKFCELLIKNNLNIKWEAQIRIEKNFPLELAHRLKQSGCFNLFIGLESASNKVLNNMNKGFDSQTALKFFKTLKAAQLHFEISLIFGYPKEGKKEFKETLTFIVKNKNIIPKIAQANPFTDYLNNFASKEISPLKSKEKIETFLDTLRSENIRYTKSFIGNLLYR